MEDRCTRLLRGRRTGRFSTSRESKAAIVKAFRATEKEFTQDIIDFLALKVTADFNEKIVDAKSVSRTSGQRRKVLNRAGYEYWARPVILTAEARKFPAPRKPAEKYCRMETIQQV